MTGEVAIQALTYHDRVERDQVRWPYRNRQLTVQDTLLKHVERWDGESTLGTGGHQSTPYLTGETAQWRPGIPRFSLARNEA